jgi:hypothetical protein
MATFIGRKGLDGRRPLRVTSLRTRTFSLKANAEAWALRVEREMESDAATGAAEAEATTLAEALERYAAEVSARKRSAKQERKRIAWSAEGLESLQNPMQHVRSSREAASPVTTQRGGCAGWPFPPGMGGRLQWNTQCAQQLSKSGYTAAEIGHIFRLI